MNIITFIQNIWNAIDGYKTYVGGVLLILGTALGQVDSLLNITTFAGVVTFLQTVGGWLGSIGVIHAVAKAVPNTTATPPSTPAK